MDWVERYKTEVQMTVDPNIFYFEPITKLKISQGVFCQMFVSELLQKVLEVSVPSVEYWVPSTDHVIAHGAITLLPLW